MLGYELVNLSSAQLEVRRKQLDSAGFNAWISPVILLATIYAHRLLPRPSDWKIISSKDASKSSSALQLLSRRVLWILNTTFVPEFGPLHVQIAGLAYLGWLLFLIFNGTGNDYMHLTKAFGHVSISQLPLQYLLSFKSPLSPITLATGLTHERLNAYHRLFGRIVHSLLATHAVLYIGFFIQASLLSKRIKDRDVRLGLLAFWMFNFLGLLSIPPIRKALYHKVFYRGHFIISALLVVVLFFHVPYTRRYVLQAGVFWLAGVLLRKRASVESRVSCEMIEDTNLVRTRIEVDDSSNLLNWTPGQHVYLKQYGLGPKNPFTIVQVKNGVAGGPAEMQLMVRNLKGVQTGYLGMLATKQQDARFEVEGPYGEASMYLPELLKQGRNAGQTLVVAGGVGATYAIPIYIALLKARGSSTGLKLSWLVKSKSDAEWGMDLLKQAEQVVDVEIHLTQLAKDIAERADYGNGIIICNDQARPRVSRIIESSFHTENGETHSETGLKQLRNLNKSYESVTVLVCGPSGLSQALRTEVGRHVLEYGKSVVWYEEQFGLGGS